MSQGFYELLGVEPDASEARIRQAYQARLAQLVRRLRTARQQGADVTILEAQERSLREAREVLATPARRWRYDAFRKAADNGMPESAGDLWEAVRASLVNPEVSLALAVLQSLTDLPVGQPVPPPPEPVRVQRVAAEAPAPKVVAPVDPDPDRPTLVPATDPGIEISLTDDELRWLDHPDTPAPVRSVPLNIHELPAPAATFHLDGPASAEVDADPWSEDGDHFVDDDFADEFSEDDIDEDPPSRDRGTSDSPSRPGLGFLSRFAIPKVAGWLDDGESEDEPLPAPAPSQPTARDPIHAAQIRFGLSGAFLRAVREHKGMSLDDVSRATRISTRYLDALESDSFDRLPSVTFVKGYIKQVAEHLGVVDSGIIEAYMAAYKQARS